MGAKRLLKTQVLIIGAGATGTGLARDLSLRGIQCALVEKGDVNAGASGANHGLLHSGARYVSSDPDVARECREEAELLKRMVPQCVENTGGLFAAVQGDDENYVADFPLLCARCGIPVKPLSAADARELEPVLSEKTIAAYMVEDASIDPFRLSLENVAHARALGALVLPHTRVVGFKIQDRRIRVVHLRNESNRQETAVEAEQVVNASGAWGAEVSALAGISIDMRYSKGTLLVSNRRLAHRVLNRLRPPSDGDILVPGGTVSILGTTSVRIGSLENVRPTIEEVDLIVNEGAEMIPQIETTRFIRAYAGVRPLLSPQETCDDRSISRGFALLDHVEDGLENMVTVPGGKLTTYRLMAEKTADLICRRLGAGDPCLTRSEPLPLSMGSNWTTPGLAPRVWMKKTDPENLMLCECEMVPKSVVDKVASSLREQEGAFDLNAVSLRSRVGKGQCQGTFCGFRVSNYLFEQGDPSHTNLRDFLRNRWRGERPVLWGNQLIQAEFKEALYCGLCNLDLDADRKKEKRCAGLTA